MPRARSAVDITVARGLAAFAGHSAGTACDLLIWINPFDILD